MRHNKLPDSRHQALDALAKFKIGDRVEYPERGWAGTVKSKSEEGAWIYCVFDGHGLAGCDPRRLVHALAAATGTAKTAQRVECEASQSGGEAVTSKRIHP